jgi:kynurenine 3-monooxygenase
VVFGADGSASAVRKELLAAPGSRCEETPLDYGYKELTIPAGPGGSFPLEKHALHIWPRGTFMLIALPNFDGSFTCTLFLPFEGPVSFAALRGPAEVEAFFREQFADAVPLIPDLAGVFFANPTGHMVTVKCSPWSRGGEALLVGDAAHAIVPFFGQGMNCGFEDCVVLDGLLEKRGADWPAVFGEYERLRKANSDAIADMAVENFTEMRDKVGNPRFLLEKEVEKILMKEFPGEYESRYRLVTFTRVDYRLALEIGAIGDGILSELCAGLGRPEDVDRKRAGALIRERMTPLLRAQRKD